VSIGAILTKANLLPDIKTHLEIISENASVTSKGLDELIYKVRAATGLSKKTCSVIIEYIFQEIRNQLLKGSQISLKRFGSFSMVRKRRIPFPKFKPAKWLKNKLNDR